MLITENACTVEICTGKFMPGMLGAAVEGATVVAETEGELVELTEGWEVGASVAFGVGALVEAMLGDAVARTTNGPGTLVPC